MTTPSHHTPSDATQETPRMPASTPRPHHTHADTDTTVTDGVVVSSPRSSTRDHPWTVERPDTEPLTAQGYDRAVSALAALIGQWNHRRDSSGSNQ